MSWANADPATYDPNASTGISQLTKTQLLQAQLGMVPTNTTK